MSAELTFALMRTFAERSSSDLPTPHRMILLTLADFAASDTGHAWPSWEKLAQITGLARSTVGLCLGELEAARWITGERRSDARGQTSTRYTMNTSGDPIARQRPGRHVAHKDASESPPGGLTPVRPADTILPSEPPNEPPSVVGGAGAPPTGPATEPPPKSSRRPTVPKRGKDAGHRAKVKPAPDEEPSGYPAVVAAFFEAYELATGQKPAKFDGREGKEIKTLIAMVGADRAEFMIRGSYAHRAWVAKSGKLSDIVRDPNAALARASAIAPLDDDELEVARRLVRTYPGHEVSVRVHTEHRAPTRREFQWLVDDHERATDADSDARAGPGPAKAQPPPSPLEKLPR